MTDKTKGSPLEKTLATVSDTEHGRYVRIEWKQKAAPLDVNDSIYLHLRMEVDSSGHPRLPECHEEALRNARDVLTAEIQRLEALR